MYDSSQLHLGFLITAVLSASRCKMTTDYSLFSDTKSVSTDTPADAHGQIANANRVATKRHTSYDFDDADIEITVGDTVFALSIAIFVLLGRSNLSPIQSKRRQILDNVHDLYVHDLIGNSAAANRAGRAGWSFDGGAGIRIGFVRGSGGFRL
ncbi:uncharacterized protein EV422DRAFT_569912 [Fimicolochytrium jonesii]|uniref:uncharacterized protein n=1 Tax=Fimicolochytrium jonesii TaxID=1396493 RepID=UPI0022FF3D7C|nr:uncharacterized protein EV422DRAFT_569912 [Fimicolochytrium jonesii]KAI8818125.1 hypothetical protein EV422DRAFT_569912 [Fimicolochytrium jonesii]